MTLDVLKAVYDDFKWYPNNKVTPISQARPRTTNFVSALGRPSTCPAPQTGLVITPRPVQLLSPRYGRNNAIKRSPNAFPQWSNRPHTHHHHNRNIEYGKPNSYNRLVLLPYTGQKHIKSTIRPKTTVQHPPKTIAQTIYSARRPMLSSYGCGTSSTEVDRHPYALLPTSATSPRSSSSYVRYYLGVHATEHTDSYRVPAVRPPPAPEPPAPSTGNACLSIGMLAKISGIAGKGKKGSRRESMNSSARESLTSGRRSEVSSKHS